MFVKIKSVMKKIISYFQHSILSVFIILAAILSCEELEDEVTKSITDTTSIFDTISVMDTIIHMDSSSFQVIGEWDGITFFENDSTRDYTSSASWVRLTLSPPSILNPIHEYYFREYDHVEADTFRERGVYTVLGDSVYVLQIWNNEDDSVHHDEDMDFMRMFVELNATKDTLVFKGQNPDGGGGGTPSTDIFTFKRI